MSVLGHERVVAEGADPTAWVYFLHGIYGAGRNWGTLARRLVRERPEWGALLVDLRQHGTSQGFAPPHTVENAARDLDVLAAETGIAPAAVLGHSFGGKIALAYATAAPTSLEQLWLIDSTPSAGAPRGSAWRMLQVVRSLPDRFPDREALVAALQREGIARPVAQWMATNLEASDGGYRWRFDLDAIEQLLRDFFLVDLWRVIEDPPPNLEIHVVKAEGSDVLDAADVRRIEAARRGVHYHVLDGGHWLNADNPDGVVALLARELSPP